VVAGRGSISPLPCGASAVVVWEGAAVQFELRTEVRPSCAVRVASRSCKVLG
jgi:hypothetical protein